MLEADQAGGLLDKVSIPLKFTIRFYKLIFDIFNTPPKKEYNNNKPDPPPGKFERLLYRTLSSRIIKIWMLHHALGANIVKIWIEDSALTTKIVNKIG